MDPSQSSSGSLPPVQLPVVHTRDAEDETQGDTSATPGALGNMDEKDLFGSSSEEEAVLPASGSAPAAVATAPGSKPAEDAEERDLFGSEAGENLDERDLFGTDDEGGEGLDEKDLFGSDEEAAPGGVRAPTKDGAAQPRSPAPTEATAEPSEMDEEDIFGRDLSDDEGVDERKEMEEVILRRRPMPKTERPFAALRMPNILQIEKKPFNPLKFSEDVRKGFREQLSTQSKQTVKLLNPENVIRWRFKKSEEGQILTSDDGRPQYESNSRIVEWEDGSRTLFVGSEAFPVSTMPDNVLLFEENSQEVSVCHGFIQQRMVATPRSLSSATHESIKKAQFTKYEPTSRSLLINTDDQVFLQQQQQMERDLAKDKEKRDKRMLKAGAGEDSRMNAAFLEDDDDGVGPSVKRPKNN